MSLQDLAAADSLVILTMDGEIVTLTAPVVAPATVGVAYTVHTLYLRIGQDIDADGFPVASAKSSVTLSTSELAALGITDPEALKTVGWTITARGVVYRVEKPMIDYALGQITTIIKKAS